MAKPRDKAGKLFSLREWLTLKDAAHHLSLVLEEEVFVTDLYRLALERKLTLSAHFVNEARGKLGKLIPARDVKFRVYPGLSSPTAAGLPSGALTGPELGEKYPEILDRIQAGEAVLSPQNALLYTRPDVWLELDEEVRSIDGIWDLPMVGAEALDIEHLYQMETGGPSVTLTVLEGVVVTQGDRVCQLHELLYDRPPPRQTGQGVAESVDEPAQIELPPIRFPREHNEYFPAPRLPDDAVLVVRVEAIRQFERLLVEDSSDQRALTSREQATMQNIIGGLLGLLLGSSPSGKPHSVFRSQAAVIDALLAEHDGKPGIAKRTLEEKFAQAKRKLWS